MPNLYRPNLAGVYQQSIENKRKRADLGLRKEALDAEIRGREEARKLEGISKMIEVAGPTALPGLMKQLGAATGIELDTDDMERMEQFKKDWVAYTKMDADPQTELEAMRNLLSNYKGIGALEREREGLTAEMEELGGEVRETVRRGIPREFGGKHAEAYDVAGNLIQGGQPELAEEVRGTIPTGADGEGEWDVYLKSARKVDPDKTDKQHAIDFANRKKSVQDFRTPLQRNAEWLTSVGIARDLREGHDMAMTQKYMRRSDWIAMQVAKFSQSGAVLPSTEEIAEFEKRITFTYDDLQGQEGVPKERLQLEAQFKKEMEGNEEAKGWKLDRQTYTGQYMVIDEAGKPVHLWSPE